MERASKVLPLRLAVLAALAGCSNNYDPNTGEAPLCVDPWPHQDTLEWVVCDDGAVNRIRGGHPGDDCLTGDDCRSGECGVALRDADPCGMEYAFACRRAGDPCRSDQDCKLDQNCTIEEGRFECRTLKWCTVGRPLSTADGVIRAPVAARSDWTMTLELLVEPHLRTAVAEFWTGVARMEHASVASFARFTLELLALGAPPELLAEAQAAAADEVRHARLAFAVASAAGGASVGPGGLEVGAALTPASLEEFLDRLVFEACVGEVYGAALLHEQAEHVAHGELSELLRRAAEDETRHAALGWRTLAWLLERHPDLRDGLEARFRMAVSRLREGLTGAEAHAPAWGLLDRRHCMELFDEVVLCVIEPALAAVRR